jgi:hypothetical protein
VSAATPQRPLSRTVFVFLVIVAFVVAAIVVGSLSQSPVVASQLNYNIHMNVNGFDVNGWTVDRCPTTTANGTGPWVCSIITNGVIQNNSLRFLTGQVVQVNLWFEYLKKPVDPTTITLMSVAAGSGFQIIKVEEPVPFSMSGWGSQSGLVLQLRVLPGQHSGSVDMSVRFSV